MIAAFLEMSVRAQIAVTLVAGFAMGLLTVPVTLAVLAIVR